MGILTIGPMVSDIVQAFHRLHFTQQMTSTFFILRFLGEKDEITCQKKFSFVAHISDERYRN